MMLITVKSRWSCWIVEEALAWSYFLHNFARQHWLSHKGKYNIIMQVSQLQCLINVMYIYWKNLGMFNVYWAIHFSCQSLHCYFDHVWSIRHANIPFKFTKTECSPILWYENQRQYILSIFHWKLAQYHYGTKDMKVMYGITCQMAALKCFYSSPQKNECYVCQINYLPPMVLCMVTLTFVSYYGHT